MWDLIVSVPDHCLSFYFSSLTTLLPVLTCFIFDNIAPCVDMLHWQHSSLCWHTSSLSTSLPVLAYFIFVNISPGVGVLHLDLDNFASYVAILHLLITLLPVLTYCKPLYFCAYFIFYNFFILHVLKDIYSDYWKALVISLSEGQILIDIMNDHGLEQMIHFTFWGKNTLDLILTTLPGQFQDVHSPDKLSDHDIISGTSNIFIPPNKETSEKGVSISERWLWIYEKRHTWVCKGKILQWSLGYRRTLIC